MNFYIQIALALAGVAVAAYLGYLGYLYWFGSGNPCVTVKEFDSSTGNGLLVWTGDNTTKVYQLKVYNTQDKQTPVYSDSISSSYDGSTYNYELSSQCFPSSTTGGQNKSFYITLNDTCVSDVLTLTN